MLQSKKVKLVATKSGPFWTLTDSLEVKWDSPEGMMGRRSFLQMKSKLSSYRIKSRTIRANNKKYIGFYQ